MSVALHHGDCLEVLRGMPEASVDAIVTDPPYGLSFMGKRWDYDVPSVEVWAECLRVLKPGGYLLAFAGTRTQHRMAVRIEDAGFEIRDMIAWVYGSGFPKSLDVARAIDAMDASAERRERALRFTEWMRGTGLSPARINELTGTNMGSHYTTAASQPAVATREHFEILRPHFGCEVPDWVERLVDERTVESENLKRREVISIAEKAPSGWDMDGGTKYVDRPITAPLTDDAKRWKGWGTALKPALEPITVARKPLVGTVAENVLAHGTGALNIDGCRVSTDNKLGGGNTSASVDRTGKHEGWRRPWMDDPAAARAAAERSAASVARSEALGRWPANLIHDGSDEVVALFPAEAGAQAPVHRRNGDKFRNAFGTFKGDVDEQGSTFQGDAGSAARFFYCAKASPADREHGLEHLPAQAFGMSGAAAKAAAEGRDYDNGDGGFNQTRRRRNIHPTVKPTDLMRWLCRLITPPGGVVLDPFMGSGSTGRGAVIEGFRFIGIEREEAYVAIARARITAAKERAEAARFEAERQGSLFA